MRLLVIDIETSPSLAYVWKLWRENIGLSQLVEATEMISFAAQWDGERNPIQFYSTFHNGKAEMVTVAHDLLDAADAVIHFNGRAFDTPHLNREFLLAGLTPPSPYKQIDLYQVVKKQFRFMSGKLDHVVQQLHLGQKLGHEGFGLWKACLDDDPQAWDRMRRYNKKDVALTRALYRMLLPWIPGHPSHAAFEGREDICPKCRSTKFKRDGYAYTAQGKFPQFRCENGCWWRSTKSLSNVKIREVAQ